jgi:hypothetical protein
VRKAFLAGCGTKMGMACGTFHSFQPCRLIVFACGSKNKSNGPGRSKSLKFDHLRDLWQSMAIYGNLWQSLDHDEYQYMDIMMKLWINWNIKGADSAAPLASKYRSLKPSAWRAKVTCRAVG